MIGLLPGSISGKSKFETPTDTQPIPEPLPEGVVTAPLPVVNSLTPIPEIFLGGAPRTIPPASATSTSVTNRFDHYLRVGTYSTVLGRTPSQSEQGVSGTLTDGSTWWVIPSSSPYLAEDGQVHSPVAPQVGMQIPGVGTITSIDLRTRTQPSLEGLIYLGTDCMLTIADSVTRMVTTLPCIVEIPTTLTTSHTSDTTYLPATGNGFSGYSGYSEYSEYSGVRLYSTYTTIRAPVEITAEDIEKQKQQLLSRLQELENKTSIQLKGDVSKLLIYPKTGEALRKLEL